MKCDLCRKSATILVTMVNVTTNESQHVCDNCLIENSPLINDINELDVNIADAESVLKDLEGIQQLAGKDIGSEFADNEELSAMIFTPSKAYDMMKKTCDSLAIQKLQLLTSMPDLDRLKYELKIAIEKENYEKAAELRDKINALNSN